MTVLIRLIRDDRDHRSSPTARFAIVRERAGPQSGLLFPSPHSLLSPPLSSSLPNCIPLSFSLPLCLVASVDSWSVASSRLTPSDCLPQEITLLKPHNTVYKLVGPSLVPQDQGEARVNVEKRLEYIRSEVYVCSAIHAIDSRKGGESRWT